MSLRPIPQPVIGRLAAFVKTELGQYWLRQSSQVMPPEFNMPIVPRETLRTIRQPPTPTVQLMQRVSPELHAAVTAAAAKRGMSVNNWAIMAFTAMLKEEGGDRGEK